MGRVAEWLARRGAPGGTARWAVRLFAAIRSRYPDSDQWTDAAVFRMMIAQRYSTFRETTKEATLISSLDDTGGLMGLVVAILNLEASLAENPRQNVSTILEAVGHELRKSDLPHATLFGVRDGPQDFVDHVYLGS